MPLIKLIRPKHWLKNLLLFFPPFLGGVFFTKVSWTDAVLSFLSFSLIASSVYIINDFADLENDRNHPTKRFRPLAANMLSKQFASVLLLLLLCVSCGLALLISSNFLIYILIYFTVFTGYSFFLKDIPIVDIFCISIGFLLRLKAGGEAFDVVVSDWLFLSVFFLSLFLSIGKRLSEKQQLGGFAGKHRQSLDKYPEGYLDGLMILCAAAVLVTYTMYIVDRPQLIYTILVCSFGLFRYLLLVKNGSNGDPTDALINDKQLCVTALLWLILMGHFIYID